MANEYYIKERRYNGTDYDTLYPTVTPIDGMVKTANGKSAVAQAGVDYQGVLTAGKNIKIENNVISATGGLLPTVTVTAPTGSTVTASKNGEVVTAVEVGGTWTFNLPSLGTWTVTAVKGSESASDEVAVERIKDYTLKLSYTKIYGVHWDGTASTALTRTDDAALFPDPNPYYIGNSNPSSPFDNLYPWNGMQIVENTEAGTLVSIPKFWFKIDIASDNSMDIKIANYPVDGFSISPAHMDRGDGKGERDVVYIGRYHCNDSNYKSLTGYNVKKQVSRATFRTRIHNLGSTVWQNDIHTRIAIWLLYLVEFANWNSQTCIGYGCAHNVKTGYTNSMPYHTGITSSGRNKYNGIQYRYIEGLWDEVYDLIDGIYFNEGSIYIINNPSYFSDNSDGTYVLNIPASGGYPTAWQQGSEAYNWLIFPKGFGGSVTTYVPDLYDRDSSSTVLGCGGASGEYYTLSAGLFSLRGFSGISDTMGSRLMVLP